MADFANDWSPTKALRPALLTVAIFFTSLVYLSFPNRVHRYEAAAIVGALAGAAWFNSDELFPDSFVELVYLRTLVIYLSYFLYLVFREEKSSTKTATIHDAFLSPPKNPWLRGYKLLFNGRGIGTDWQMPYLWRNVPDSHSTNGRRDVIAKSSAKAKLHSRGRWAGVAVRVAYLLLNFTVFCIYYEILDPALWVQLRPSDTTKEKESVFLRAIQLSLGNETLPQFTRRELGVRLWAVAASVVHDYLILSMYHDIFAIIFIASGLDEDWEWPPLFGPITEAYTMRRYWSIFWHRLIYKSFNVHAAALLGCLGMNHRTALHRFLKNSLVFLLSAVNHALISWRVGDRCAGRDAKYWLLQPIAFVVEGLVAYHWKKLRSNWLTKAHPKMVSTFERCAGYVWVFLWLLWCTPKARFPMVFCEVE
ncbi:hypothetical protein ACN47E_003200 [Coniothyrium glycines]